MNLARAIRQIAGRALITRRRRQLAQLRRMDALDALWGADNDQPIG